MTSRTRALMISLAAGASAFTGIAVVLGVVRTGQPPAATNVAPAISPGPQVSGAPLCVAARVAKKDMSDCGRLSFTGAAPACIVSAECSDGHVTLDCVSAGPGWCRCEGGAGRRVPYEASFCALDPEAASRSLRALLDHAAVACKWKGPE